MEVLRVALPHELGVPALPGDGHGRIAEVPAGVFEDAMMGGLAEVLMSCSAEGPLTCPPLDTCFETRRVVSASSSHALKPNDDQLERWRTFIGFCRLR